MSTTNLRLLFVVEHFRRAGSGAENDAVALCRALAALGHDVHVVARTAHPFAEVTTHEGWDDVAAVRRQVAPDVTVDWGLFGPADVYRLGGGVHAEFIRYALASYGGVGRLWKALRYHAAKHRRIIAAERDLLRRPETHVAAISEFVAAQARHAGVPADRVRVLHNAVELTRFERAALAARRAAQRAGWGLPDGTVACLFVAHNLRLKNLQLLAKIFPQAYAVCPQLRLVVVGKRAPGFTAPWLIYAGATERIEDFYAGADALLHPTYYDSFGNVVLEAMAAGLAVVVSDRAGAAELITDRDDGMVLPVVGANAVTDWRVTTVALGRDPDFRRRLSEAARRTAEGHPFARYVHDFSNYLQEVAPSCR